MDTIIIFGVISFFALYFIAGAKSDLSMQRSLQAQKNKAMRPPVSKALLRKTPTEGDLILGKQKEKYVCWDTRKDGHFLIIGGSGSGKSSCIVIPFLLTNPNATVFAIDIKGELVSKGREIDDPRICVFSPNDHSGYGFDVFYSINNASNPQEILSCMQTISYSLIPLGNTSEQFWPISARNMLCGLLIHYYCEGYNDLISIVDCILGCPIRDQIEDIINSDSPNSNSYRYLNQFSGMADATLLSVYSNMANSLSCFSDENLRWAFSGAARKASPVSLEYGKSVFLSIPEHKLAPYAGPLAMIVNLTLDALSKRPEGRPRIFILLDELGRIISSGGALDGLIDASMTLRSRAVTLCLVVQQIESLRTGFPEHKVTTLVGNCNVKIVLDASSSKTQKTVCSDWVPKYIQRRQSKSTGSKSPSHSTSFDEKDRLSPSDLMELTRNDEAVIITPLGYSMIKKVPYYKDKLLKAKADAIKKHNQFLMERR